MKRILPVIAAVVFAAACNEANDPASLESVAAAFQTVPVGFDNAQTSYTGAVSGENYWGPEGRGHGRDGHGRPGFKGPGWGLFMGGGLAGLFMGDGFGPGFGRGRGDPILSNDCTFDAGSGRVICNPVTRGGLTINKSASYADANGATQQAFDSATTNTINTRIAVAGTITRRRDSATSVVDGASDRTVAGLAPASTQRTINGTSRATENISGTDSTGTYTAVRVAGDTSAGIVIPKTAGGGKPYPTAGTVTRSMQITLTRNGQSPVVSTRREVVTYDGSATAKLVITHDGTTKNCTLPLPHGRISCS